MCCVTYRAHSCHVLLSEVKGKPRNAKFRERHVVIIESLKINEYVLYSLLKRSLFELAILIHHNDDSTVLLHPPPCLMHSLTLH